MTTPAPEMGRRSSTAVQVSADSVLTVATLTSLVLWALGFLTTRALALALVLVLSTACLVYMLSVVRGGRSRPTVILPIGMLIVLVVIGEIAFGGIGSWWMQAIAFLVVLFVWGLDLTFKPIARDGERPRFH